MLTLRIGGVPEHFNLPWHLLLESDWPKTNEMALSWSDFPAGTGAMIDALSANAIDVAMLVTEGAVTANQSVDCPFEIISFYTKSPLLWGIHVPASSTIDSIDAIRNMRYAISRFGSGSHIMARVHAAVQQWPVDDIEFIIVNDIHGARQAFQQQQAEVFFWEHFTTKPYVDNGEFRWLGDFPPPWPGFVVVARKTLSHKKKAAIGSVINAVLQQAETLKNSAEAIQLISQRYQLPPADVEEWLSVTHWQPHCHLDRQELTKINALL